MLHLSRRKICSEKRDHLSGRDKPGHDHVSGTASFRTSQKICKLRETRMEPDYHSAITLTWAATTNQPSGKRTQVCICRPTLPGMVGRWNRVEAIPKSRP